MPTTTTSPQRNLDIGVLRSDERPQFIDLMVQAFAFPHEDADPWLDSAGADQLRGLREDGELKGGLMHVPMGLYIGGRSVPMVGIAGVAIRLDARRRGLAAKLMRATLQELHQQGVALSTLYASTYALYQSVGYDVAATCYRGHVDPRLLPGDGRGGSVEMLSAANRAEVEATWRAHHASGLGPDCAIDRGPYLWERLLGERRGNRATGVVVRGDDGQIAGWVSYRTEPGNDRHRVRVQDLFASEPWAVRRVWAALADLSAMATEVDFATAADDPFLLALAQPRFDVRLYDYLLLRVVDPVAAVAARGFVGVADSSVEFHLTDPDLPQNSGTWRLEVRAGRGRLTPGANAELALDARAFACLYAGIGDAGPIYLSGRQIRGPRATQNRLAAMLATRGRWLVDAF
jgi:predicted acetyltransferase